MSLTVNPHRFQSNFDALAEFGATGDGGVHRPCWSEPHLAAQRWWLARAEAAGLETRRDSAGNCSAVLRSARPGARTLLLGSHTDSVPNGGRFDGALGVMAALEAVRTLKDAGLALPVHVEAIDFSDEEGTLVGELGSSALAGHLLPAALAAPRGGRAGLEAALARAGLTEAGLFAARRAPSTLAGYLELHIEQGPELARQALPIGVVTGIVGITSLRVTYTGQANHAGTTPMTLRHDAALGAAAFTLAAREMVVRDYAGCTANVGQISLAPGAFNIVPGEARLALEFRSPDPAQLQDLEHSLLGLADLIARRYALALAVEPFGGCPPAPMGPKAQAAIAAAADSLALAHTALPSGAGHDAQMLAPLTETGMLFIPSRDGASHSPLEHSDWDRCVDGANVLLRAALKLAKG
jgi:beta-ureidopropionase / N-carbamoyl-L-amino-acid hydrolase